jgi:hypothetical protein
MSQSSGGKVRFSLAALAAAGVLYGAVVMFGLGSASPVALGPSDGRGAPVVRVPSHDPAVPGPVRRLPQASPGPARRHAARASASPARKQPGRGGRHGVTSGAKGQSAPAKPRTSESVPPSIATPAPLPTVPVPSVPVPPIPPVTLPSVPLPPVQVPAVPVPVPPLPLP